MRGLNQTKNRVSCTCRSASIVSDPVWCPTTLLAPGLSMRGPLAMRALRDFVEKNGTLPLTGSIPDMTSDTTSYIALQNAFQKRAAADTAAVAARVAELVEEHGCTPLSEDFVKLVCKNANNLRVKRFASLQIQNDPTSGWVLAFAMCSCIILQEQSARVGCVGVNGRERTARECGVLGLWMRGSRHYVMRV